MLFRMLSRCVEAFRCLAVRPWELDVIATFIRIKDRLEPSVKVRYRKRLLRNRLGSHLQSVIREWSGNMDTQPFPTSALKMMDW